MCRQSDVVGQRYTAALASPPDIGSGACELWTLGIGAVCEREKLAVIDSGLVTIARGLGGARRSIVSAEAVRLGRLRHFIRAKREIRLASLRHHSYEPLPVPEG